MLLNISVFWDHTGKGYHITKGFLKDGDNLFTEQTDYLLREIKVTFVIILFQLTQLWTHIY